MPFVLDSKTSHLKDFEKNAELRSVQGYRGGFVDWEILWGNEIIGFRAKDNRSYGGETQNIVNGIHWFVDSIKVPEGLQDQRPEILALIRDALESYHLFFPKLDVKISVEFHPRFDPYLKTKN